MDDTHTKIYDTKKLPYNIKKRGQFVKFNIL